MHHLKLFLLILIIPFTTWAASPAEISDLEFRLNNVFEKQLEAKQLTGISFRVQNEAQDYIGGVNIDSDKIQIIVGAAALQKYTLEALRFLSCHEVGHILGGAPYKPPRYGQRMKSFPLSTEGQSDYWAGLECLPKISPTPEADALAFFTMMHFSVSDVVGDSPIYAIPVPGLEDDSFYDGEYPSFQCRYNSAIAGIEGLARPACWFRAPVAP